MGMRMTMMKLMSDDDGERDNNLTKHEAYMVTIVMVMLMVMAVERIATATMTRTMKMTMAMIMMSCDYITITFFHHSMLVQPCSA